MPYGVTQVYIGVRSLGSETEVRTRLSGAAAEAIAIPGSAWRCAYERVGPLGPVAGDPWSAPFEEYSHAVTCMAGALGAALSMTCPVRGSDLESELARNHQRVDAGVLVLIESEARESRRTFVTLSCEP